MILFAVIGFIAGLARSKWWTILIAAAAGAAWSFVQLPGINAWRAQAGLSAHSSVSYMAGAFLTSLIAFGIFWGLGLGARKLMDRTQSKI